VILGKLVMLGLLAFLASGHNPLPSTDPNRRVHELVKDSFESGPVTKWLGRSTSDTNPKLQRIHGGIE